MQSQAQLQFDMHSASARIDLATSKNAPDNTVIQDSKVRRHWNEWCRLKKFSDYNTVYDEKIWLYVDETLVKTNEDGTLQPRLAKPPGKRPDPTKVSKKRNKKPPKAPEPIGEPTVRAHLAALMKLYKEQAFTLKTNSHPVPNKDKQSKFRDTMLRMRKVEMIKHHMDRGAGSLLDGYSTQKELNALCKIAFEDTSLQSFRARVMAV